MIPRFLQNHVKKLGDLRGHKLVRTNSSSTVKVKHSYLVTYRLAIKEETSRDFPNGSSYAL